MNLAIFSCSTGFHSYPTLNKSYVERFASEYNAKGRWADGLSIFDVKREIPSYLCGNDRIVILHVGAIETFTHPVANVIEWYSNYFLRNPSDQYAMAFLFPKMAEISHALTHKGKQFFSILEPKEFEIVIRLILLILQGAKVIIVGMSKPNDPMKPFWIEQALIINQILENETKNFNFIFIDTWNLCPHCVVDSNHLNEEGHNILYEKIREHLK